jgi:hypothetical protein
MTSFSDKYCMCYYPCDGPNSADLPLFGSFLQHFFSVFVFEQLLNLYYFISRVLLRPLGGVIFITVSFYYSVYPLSLCDKKGE